MDAQQILQQLPAVLLPWYDQHRRDLPWRQEVSPYLTWVSEIMLQQTRVAAVIPYFQRFMAAFPTVEDLANCDTEQLLKLWEGLGYYSRARNLRKAAGLIAQAGAFPQTYRELTALPGIGDYTAGAILSIAFHQPVPAVDGNVLRVASRLTASRDNILDAAVRRRWRGIMESIMPAHAPGAFNQALMDLGAMVCLPGGEPDCDGCPAAALCRARALGLQRELPVRTGKPEKKVEHHTVFLLLQNGQAALRQRPDTGLLAGLWEYPHVPGTLDEAAAAAQLQQWGLTPRRWVKSLKFRHLFTHIRWELTGYVAEVSGAGPGDWLWADGKQRQQLAIPSAFEKLTREWE